MNEVESLRAHNKELENEVEILRGVIALIRDDLNVKDDQIDYLYQSFLASKEYKRKLVQRKELELQERVSQLESQMRAKDASYERMNRSLQDTQRMLAHYHAPKLDNFSSLPAVAIVMIYAFLDCPSVLNAAATHRSWYSVLMRGRTWEELYVLRWSELDNLQGHEHVEYFKDKYHSLKASISPPVRTVWDEENERLKKELSDEWLSLYRERHRVEQNWINGRAQIATLNGHSGTVTCLQFSDSQLLSGSDDGSMMLWSLNPRDEGCPLLNGGGLAHDMAIMQQHHRQKRTVEKLHSFHGHGGPVWALHFDDSLVFSGSYDKTVKMWDLQSGRCLRTLRSHTGWVSSLDGHSSRLASAGWDSSIKIWDTDTGELVSSLDDSPANPIFSLRWDKWSNTLITGCRWFGVQLWDAATGQKLSHLMENESKSQVNMVKACTNRIIAAGSDNTAKVWDRRQASLITKLSGHTGAVMSVDYNGAHSVISGSYDSTIKLWDLRTTKSPVRTYEGHSSAVFSLQMDACKMISGSADTTIKIFRFDT